MAYKYKKLFPYALIIVLLDIFTTYIVLHMDCGINTICRENNPAAAYIINNFGFIGLTLISLTLLYATYKFKPVLVYLFLIINTLATIGNIIIIMRYL